MINPSMISYFPSWCRRWNSSRPERNRRKGTTGLLAIAGATAMDSFVGPVWLGEGCEAASAEPPALANIARNLLDDGSPSMTMRNQPMAD